MGLTHFEYCSTLKTVVNLSTLKFLKKSYDYGEVAYYANKVINAPNGDIVDNFVFYTYDSKNYLAGYTEYATEVVLPDKYKGESYNIDEEAFSSETALTNITIPNNVTSIGDFSFWGCRNLTKITSFIPADKLFSVGDYTFCHVDWKNCILYVPYKAKEKYASTKGWKYFKNIIELKNTYKVTFRIDGKEIATYDINEGDTIIYPNNNEKEGHSLIWNTHISIMPSNNIIIDGTFNVNTYTVTYTIDGDIFAIDSLTYGSEIILRNAPTKEGHSFSGWSDTPKTMLAENILVEGTFNVNSYTVTFLIDGKFFTTITVEYGAEIELPTVPEKDNHIFSGWINVPKTMPANNITIEGNYIADTSIEHVSVELGKNKVFNLNGIRILDTHKLSRGIYIINYKKIFIK